MTSTPSRPLEEISDILSFKDEWLSHATSCTWFDPAEIERALRDEGAILIPAYCIHYEASNDGSGLLLQTVTTENTNSPDKKPSTESSKKALKILGLDYNRLLQAAKSQAHISGPTFHDKYWGGHAPAYQDQPKYPELIQRVLDPTVAELYSNKTQHRVNDKIPVDQNKTIQDRGPWTDWAIAVSLRVDRLFTNRPIIANFALAFYDNVALCEGHWPIVGWSDWDLNERLSSIKTMFDIQLGEIFPAQIGNKPDPHQKRNSLKYTPKARDTRATKWLNDDEMVFRHNLN